MFLLKLAIKNIMRRKKRTLLTAGVISVAVLVYIFMDSHLASMDEMSYNNIIDFESGHIQVTDSGYWEEKAELPLENLIFRPQNYISSIKDINGYHSLTGQLDFRVRLNDGRDELPVIGKGIEPQAASSVFKIDQYLIRGEIFKKGENRAVMGKSLAGDMDLQVGDYIILLVRTARNYFNTVEVEISGLIHTPNPAVNQNIVYIPLDVAQNTLGVLDKISRLVIKLDTRQNTEPAVTQLKTNLNGDNNFKIIPWYYLEAVAVNQAKQAGNNLILAIILLIAAIGIINSVILSALERVRETGMMKAMGMEEKKIVSVFVIESTGIAALGALFGCGLAAGAVALLYEYGIDYSGFFDGGLGEYGIPVIGPIYGVWNLKTFLFVFIFSTFVSLIASIFPSYWAARKDPVEALYER